MLDFDNISLGDTLYLYRGEKGLYYNCKVIEFNEHTGGINVKHIVCEYNKGNSKKRAKIFPMSKWDNSDIDLTPGVNPFRKISFTNSMLMFHNKLDMFIFLNRHPLSSSFNTKQRFKGISKPTMQELLKYKQKYSLHFL